MAPPIDKAAEPPKKDRTDTDALAEIILARTGLFDVKGTPAALLAPGYGIETLERWLPAPTRKRQAIVLQDAASFVAAVKDNDAGSTRVYFDETCGEFLAIFDNDGWRENSAAYKLGDSVEWGRWMRGNASKMDQEQFSRFIEDNIQDIIDPDGATMLEMANTLEAKKAVSFQSAIRLSDGSTQFSFDEEVKGTVTKGRLEVPSEFTVYLPVFSRGAGERMRAKFRYRISGEGRLVMWYELDRPHLVKQQAIDAAVEKMGIDIAMSILRGDPGEAVRTWL